MTGFLNLQRSQSIRRRLVLVVLAATTAALLVACAALLLYDSRVYHNSLLADLATQADIIGRASAVALAFDDQTAARENLALLKAKPGIVGGALYNAKGAMVSAGRGRNGKIAAIATRWSKRTALCAQAYRGGQGIARILHRRITARTYARSSYRPGTTREDRRYGRDCSRRLDSTQYTTQRIRARFSSIT